MKVLQNFGKKRQSIWDVFVMEVSGSKTQFLLPCLSSVSIKAAELQGRKAGIRFLRKLQEMLFLEKQNISLSRCYKHIRKAWLRC